MAAMERLRLPQKITIPLSVMFRFFPTVVEEYGAIGDAMRMRGIGFGLFDIMAMLVCVLGFCILIGNKCLG